MDEVRGSATVARRTALRQGAAVVAALSAAGLTSAAAQEATPGGGGSGSGPVMIQAFGNGSLFPTQGDGPDLPPYTAILWDAADRGVVVADPGSGSIGVIPTEHLVNELEAARTATAALAARLPEGGARDEALWLMTLTEVGLGADPGAVTYQGEGLAVSDGLTSSGFVPDALPEGAQNLESGFLIVFGLAPLSDAAGNQHPWLVWS